LCVEIALDEGRALQLLGIILPTTDVVTLLAVTVPALLFTEAGLFVAKSVYIKKEALN
jgi:Sec-independent protein secretion pathway component TatC